MGRAAKCLLVSIFSKDNREAHHLRALDGTVFNTSQMLAYLVYNMSRSLDCLYSFEGYVHVKYGTCVTVWSSCWLQMSWLLFGARTSGTIMMTGGLVGIRCAQHSVALQWCHNGCDGISNNQPHHCWLNRLFRHRSKKTSKLRVTGLCVGNSPVTGEFPAQMASNVENVSNWWCHHGYRLV